MQHTCIKDDGGTPNRRCDACEADKAIKYATIITRDQLIQMRTTLADRVKPMVGRVEGRQLLDERVKTLTSTVAALFQIVDALLSERIGRV